MSAAILARGRHVDVREITNHDAGPSQWSCTIGLHSVDQDMIGWKFRSANQFKGGENTNPINKADLAGFLKQL